MHTWNSTLFRRGPSFTRPRLITLINLMSSSFFHGPGPTETLHLYVSHLLVSVWWRTWFKWTYFHERLLLYLQSCYQVHDAAKASSRGTSVSPWPAEGPAFPATVKRLLYAALLGERQCEQSRRFHERLYHALLWAGSFCVVSFSSDFLLRQSTLESFDTELFMTKEELPAK
jgi:hypothetical protein